VTCSNGALVNEGIDRKKKWSILESAAGDKAKGGARKGKAFHTEKKSIGARPGRKNSNTKVRKKEALGPSGGKTAG